MDSKYPLNKTSTQKLLDEVCNWEKEEQSCRIKSRKKDRKEVQLLRQKHLASTHHIQIKYSFLYI